MQVTQPGGQLWNQAMQVTSPDDQILNQFATNEKIHTQKKYKSDCKKYYKSEVEKYLVAKGAGYSDSFRKTTEELSGRGTSRHPKVV